MSKLSNIIGQKFKRLTVISRAPNSRYGDVRWNCLCDCGNFTIAYGQSLKKGSTGSCGCLRTIVGRANAIDLTGQIFSRLTVLYRVGNVYSGKHVQWACQCSCGNQTKVTTQKLRFGHTKSCGCLRIDSSTQNATTHGQSSTPEYYIWCGMLARCYDPNNKRYLRYGGRGIVVHPSWHQFENFFADMGHRPTPGHTLERIDNDGNYEPSNCRWVTQHEQLLKRRRYREGFCIRGHLLEGDNVYSKRAQGIECRTCKNARGRKSYYLAKLAVA